MCGGPRSVSSAYRACRARSACPLPPSASPGLPRPPSASAPAATATAMPTEPSRGQQQQPRDRRTPARGTLATCLYEHGCSRTHLASLHLIKIKIAPIDSLVFPSNFDPIHIFYSSLISNHKFTVATI